ncbi:MAG: cupin domain-containing protein [Maribacter sp.]|nr:cupin domain-containing protein [Maribacter sp.]
MKIDKTQALDSVCASGAQFLKVFGHGTLSVEIYRPDRIDLQEPHIRDEVYVIISGSGTFFCDGQRTKFTAGDLLFVAAGVAHRFENFTADFATWVLFYGPVNGEKNTSH